MTNYTDLTAFKRDILWTLAGIGPTHGLAIIEEMESRDYGEVLHGRLYPNLDQLADAGLIEKGEYDDRTNRYELTADAREMLQLRLSWERNQSGADFQ